MTDDLSAFRGIAKAILLSAVFWIGLILSARAQEVKATINDQDLATLNQIIAEQVPSKWAQPFAFWINGLVQRQQKIDADKKAAEAAKAEPKKDEAAPKQ